MSKHLITFFKASDPSSSQSFRAKELTRRCLLSWFAVVHDEKTLRRIASTAGDDADVASTSGRGSLTGARADDPEGGHGHGYGHGYPPTHPGRVHFNMSGAGALNRSASPPVPRDADLSGRTFRIDSTVLDFDLTGERDLETLATAWHAWRVLAVAGRALTRVREGRIRATALAAARSLLRRTLSAWRDRTRKKRGARVLVAARSARRLRALLRRCFSAWRSQMLLTRRLAVGVTRLGARVERSCRWGVLWAWREVARKCATMRHAGWMVAQKRSQRALAYYFAWWARYAHLSVLAREMGVGVARRRNKRLLARCFAAFKFAVETSDRSPSRAELPSSSDGRLREEPSFDALVSTEFVGVGVRGVLGSRAAKAMCFMSWRTMVLGLKVKVRGGKEDVSSLVVRFLSSAGWSSLQVLPRYIAISHTCMLP